MHSSETMRPPPVSGDERALGIERIVGQQCSVGKFETSGFNALWGSSAFLSDAITADSTTQNNALSVSAGGDN